MLCDNLEGWGGEGVEGGSRGRGHMHTYGGFMLLQKPTQHFNAIILYLKIKKIKLMKL